MFTAQDAQRALAFAIPQLSYIEAEAYRIQYASIRYHDLVPVDTSANAWAPSVTYFSVDGVGSAQWVNSGAQDIPNAELLRTKYQIGVKLAGIGYRWDIEELAQAQALGMNLSADKAILARRISEEFIDQIALFGDTNAGYKGLLNSSDITATTAAATGTASATTFASKTPANILADVNTALTGIYTGTSTVETADTLLLPIAGFVQLSTTPFNTYSERSILSFIKENNVLTAETGRPLMIRGVRGLDTAGASSTGRMVAYTRSPEVVKMHMPFQFLPPMQVAPLVWEVPGIFRLGGVDIRRPGAFAYVDGV